MAQSLAERMIKSSKLKGSGQFSKILKEEKKVYDTGVPALNLAYSGTLDGGVSSGVTCLAGKSKSFKTLFGLISCKAYLDVEPDAYMVFYDSEGGASESYFESVGIDPDRVIYIPVMNIEELKFDIMEKLEAIKEEYEKTKQYAKFVFFVDSIGNLASIKEMQDAKDHKSVVDMTRAKALKQLFRIVTPYFKQYQMKMINIMHTYDEIGGMGAPKQIMSGGTGPMYSADEVFIVGKRQIKEGKDIIGWQFILNTEKSRTIREKSSIPFDVTYENGMDRYSGLLDIALATGHVTCPSMGWYTREIVEDDKKWRRKETSTEEFWGPMLKDQGFLNSVSKAYCLNSGSDSSLVAKRLDAYLSEGEELDTETGEIKFDD